MADELVDIRLLWEENHTTMASSASLKSLEGDWQYTSEKVLSILNKVNPLIVIKSKFNILTQFKYTPHVHEEKNVKKMFFYDFDNRRPEGGNICIYIVLFCFNVQNLIAWQEKWTTVNL